MSSWEDRATEAEHLAPQAGTADADARLLALLLDPEDTAVSTAAADALLAREDVAGLRLYTFAFGQAADDTRNKLGDCLYDDIGSRWEVVERLLVPLTEDPDPLVKQGVVALRQHMAVESETHRR